MIEKALDGEKSGVEEDFSDQVAWPVTISYFKRSAGSSGEGLPLYEASFLLYESGISRRLVMRYPDYSLKADLQKLELLEKTSCN